MIARSASEAPGFTPSDRPRAAVASDGTLAAITESTRVVVVEIPGGAPFAEIGIDTAAEAIEVAWVSAPPRLILLSRYRAHSTVHLIDPYGPRTLGEIQLESPMKLFASVGAHALAIGSRGAAVLTASDSHLTPYQFPARNVPVAAGAAAGQFVVALEAAIEEWDPQLRIPKRRLRLARPAVITAVGGSDRVVWMTTQQAPSRIDVIPLVNRGQPKAHELPEPIAFATGHPRSDLVACVGAESGRLYVVDLDGRARLRVIELDTISRTEAAALVVGRLVGVLAAQAHQPVAIVSLDGRPHEIVPAPAPAAIVASEPEPPPVGSTLGDDDLAHEAAPPTTVESAIKLPPVVPVPSVATPGPGKPDSAPPPARPDHRASRFSAWRDRMRQGSPRSEPSAALPWVDPRPSWRDDAAAWARAIAVAASEPEPPSAPAIDTLLERFELAAALMPALVLLYGAHLIGERGVAPVELARVLGRRWDEALGRGQLAARGLVEHLDSRVRLAPPILRALDELPVATGVVVGEPAPFVLLGPCAVVAADEPLPTTAERCLPRLGGAILAAHDDASLREVLLEARARGAVAMLRLEAALVSLPSERAVIVVPDEATAEQIGLPLLT